MRFALDHLVDDKRRENSGIELTNVYVFALAKGSFSYFRGHVVLERMSQLSGAEKPELLRTANLSKHVATMSQILNLKKNELDHLAQFIRHDIRIRLPNDIVQTAQVVKVLLTMENGTIEQWRGKSLEEIDVTDVAGEPYIYKCRKT